MRRPHKHAKEYYHILINILGADELIAFIFTSMLVKYKNNRRKYMGTKWIVSEDLSKSRNKKHRINYHCQFKLYLSYFFLSKKHPQVLFSLRFKYE